MMYIHIKYCIPTEKLQVEYCFEHKTKLTQLEGMKGGSYIVTCAAFIVHQLHASCALAGVIAAAPTTVLFGVLLWHLSIVNRLDVKLLAYTKELLADYK